MKFVVGYIAVLLAAVLAAIGQAKMLQVQQFEMRHEDDTPIFSSDERRHLAGRKLDMTNPPRILKLSFTVDDQERSVELERERSTVFTSEAKMHIHEDDGLVKEFPIENTHVYRCLEREWQVRFYHDDAFEGIFVGDEFLTFSYDNGRMLVETSVSEHFRTGILQSLTFEPEHFEEAGRSFRELQRTPFNVNCYRGENRKHNFRIGVAVGKALYNELINGVRNDAQIQLILRDFIDLITGISNDIFEENLGIIIQVNSVVVANTDSTGSATPWNDPTCVKDISTQLFELQRWNQRPTSEGLWHLLDACFKGRTLGIAKLSVLCSRSVNVGVSFATGNGGSFNTLPLDLDEENNFADQNKLVGYPTWATYAHELGHNFGASHSFEEGQGRTGGIMDYGTIQARLINNLIQFNVQYRKRELCGEINSIIVGCPFVSFADSPTAAPTSSCTEFSQKVYRGVADVDAGGFDGSTRASCEARCNANAACKSFVVSEARGYCELWSKTSTNDLDDTNSAAGEDSFSTFICDTIVNTEPPSVPPTVAPTEPPPRQCVRHRNRVIFGTADLFAGSYDGWTLQECLDACNKDDCKVFIHSERLGYCELWSTGDESQFSYYFGYDSIICSVANEAVAVSQGLSDNIADKDISAIAASCCSSETDKVNLAEGTFPVLSTADADECTNLCVQSEVCLTSSYERGETEFNCELFSIKNFTGVGGEFAGFDTSDCDRACITRATFEQEFGALTPVEIGIIAAVSVGVVLSAVAFVAVRRTTRGSSSSDGIEAKGGHNSVNHYADESMQQHPTVNPTYQAQMQSGQQQGHYMTKPTL